MIKKLYIENYKRHRSFELPLDSEMNIIVGDNESGKSTILEAINLALTCKLNGRPAFYELSSYLFNQEAIDAYINDLREGKNPELPRILIEIYLTDRPEYTRLKGSINSKRENCPGISLQISFNNDYQKVYESLLAKRDIIKTIPVEYYEIGWFSFGFDPLTNRSLPIAASLIDAISFRFQTGTDYYLSMAIKESLSPKERAELAVTYRGLREGFGEDPAIQTINKRLAEYQSIISDRTLNVSIDVSQRANWETGLIPYLDQLPFHFSGRGEQSIVKTLIALERKADRSQIVLLEEPENHLSFSSMSKFVKKIATTLKGKQIILTTHSPYILNKLGLEKLILLSNGKHTTLAGLSPDTIDYFMKLPGFDTLRLILAKKVILVEGPSDELIIQRAYRDAHDNRMPLDDGIDVISVKSLSFKRFLDIAKGLATDVRVVTDNDGNYDHKITSKYAEYSKIKNISICASSDNACNNIERQLVKVNEVTALATLLGVKNHNKQQLIDYMENNKTEYALSIFEAKAAIKYPEHIQDAIK